LQSRLGYALPFTAITLLHTHNSFNATGDTTPPTISGTDANQLYSLTDQLRMDIRASEGDVHWMPGREGTPQSDGFEPMVCHGYTDNGAPHVGCSYERPLD